MTARTNFLKMNPIFSDPTCFFQSEFNITLKETQNTDTVLTILGILPHLLF